MLALAAELTKLSMESAHTTRLTNAAQACINTVAEAWLVKIEVESAGFEACGAKMSVLPYR